MGQEADTVDRAYPYIFLTLPGFYFNMLQMIMQHLVNSNKRFDISMKTMFLSVVVHAIAVYIFMVTLPWGVYGAAVAASIHLASRYFIMLALVYREPELKELISRPFDSECFSNLKN